MKEKLSNPSTDQEKEEPHEELLPQEEIKTEEEEFVKQVDEHNGQVPEVPAAEQEQAVPVHQGQPEI